MSATPLTPAPVRWLPRGRWVRAGLVGCAVLALAHQATRWDWLIDDAAICFAYARNVAQGHGFVPFPGGERVEGVSDPTWTALLVALQLVGLDGFTVIKPLAMLTTVLTLPVVWATARRAMPDVEGDEGDVAALAAPFAFAAYAQVAIWAASGLENPLWSLLLTGAILATATDAASGRFARSALLWLGVAWTRPEGIVYAALGGGWWLLHLARAGHPVVRPTVGWLATFFVPSAALYGLRWWYFAWPLSNTWYAKVQARPTYPFDWGSRGWNQLREWAGRLWYGWYFPVYLAGLVGVRGRVTGLAWAVVGALVLSLAWPGPDVVRDLWWWPAMPPPPAWFTHLRMAGFALVGFGFPWLTLGRPGADVRGLAWLCASTSMAFSVYADGDWMGAYRWMSLLCGPAAILFAGGLRDASAWIRERVPDPALASIAVALVVLGLLPPNASQTRDHWAYNRNETPSMVAFRARYTRDLVRRTFFEGEVVNLEMDMGAHLWFAPGVRHLDLAGLVDVPMSRHWYHQRPFVEEYLFTEHTPTFAHMHGWWAKETGLTEYEWWQRWMVPLRPYVDQEPLPRHPGVFVNRALFTVPAWTGGDERRVSFDGGVVLHGVEVPVATWPAGGEGYLEVALTRDRAEDFSLVAFLHRQGRVIALDLPVGMGELPASKWRFGEEVYVGRHAFPVPAGTPPGEWELGLVVLDADGRVLRAVASGDAARDHLLLPQGNDAAYAVGEVRFGGLVTVGGPADADEAERRLVDEVVVAAERGWCEDAERAFVRARRTHPRDWLRHEALRERVAPDLAACWAGVAEERGIDALAAAHRWSPDSPALRRAGGPIGERLWAEGLAAREAGDAEAAYAAFSSLLRFQPWRSWARRYAEDARDTRLGLIRGSRATRSGPSHPGMDDGEK
jgi:hypothetical protein